MDYKTIRAAKMSNCCSDCQKSLDLAGHLFMRRTKDVAVTKAREDTEAARKGTDTNDLIAFFTKASDTKCANIMLGERINRNTVQRVQDEWSGCLETIRTTMEGRHTADDARYGKTIAPEVSQMVNLSEVVSQKEWAAAVSQLAKLSDSLRTTDEPPVNFVWSYPLKQLIHGLLRKEQHTIANADVRKKPKTFDSQFVRHELREEDKLTVTWYDMETVTNGKVTTIPRTEKYFTGESMWHGDDQCGSKNIPCLQQRQMKQSRLFVTYALHKPLTDKENARIIMEKMADAARLIFGSDKIMDSLLVFGFKYLVAKGDTNSDTLGKGGWAVIEKTNKEEAMSGFYGDKQKSSYVNDTFETHVESIESDIGIEIGPKRKHPHMHILLTVNHFTYVQFDTQKFAGYLEIMFKGLSPPSGMWTDPSGMFFLPDVSGGPYYDDSENPYMDIKLYPQDDWQDVISAYVRKGSMSSIVQNIASRPTPT